MKLTRPKAVSIFCFVTLYTWNFAVSQENGELMRVKLLSPVSTKTSTKGDRINALVLEPVRLSGAYLSGYIEKVKPSKKIKGTAEIRFGFDTLHFQQSTIPIVATVEQTRNSKGVENVDEEGRIISKSQKKRDILTTIIGGAVGAAVGGAVAGREGAVLGAAIGLAGALTYVVTTKGQDLEFGPGSEFLLRVWERSP